MFDLQRVAATAAPALEDHRAVGHRVHGRTLGCGVVHARVGPVDLVDGVLAGVGEARADARIFERRLQHLLAQAGAVVLPIPDLLVLPERNGVVLLAPLLELRTPDAADADRHRVVHEALVVDHREAVALLYAEEVHGPLVDVLQLGGQCVGQLLLHDGAPERRLDRGGAFPAAQRELLLAAVHAQRVARQREDHVARHVLLVDQVVGMGRVERVLVDEDRIAVARTDVAQREDLGGGLVEPVDHGGRHPV